MSGQSCRPTGSATWSTAMPETRRGALIGIVIALAALGGVALIVLGIAWGGLWRVASGGVTALGIALIVVPGFIQHDNNNGGKK